MKKVIALIPARGGSKGIPNKNLVELNGKPLIYYTIEKALKLFVDTIIVSTDDENIKNYVLFNNFGNKIIVDDRPEELATDRASLDDLLIYITGKYSNDIVVLLQPTSPLLDYSYINQGIIDVLKGHDCAISVYHTSKADMLLWDFDKKEPINYDYKNRGIRQIRNDCYGVETGGFYVTTIDQIRNGFCRIGGNISFIETPFWQSFEVDEPEDLVMIEKLMR